MQDEEAKAREAARKANEDRDNAMREVLLGFQYASLVHRSFLLYRQSSNIIYMIYIHVCQSVIFVVYKCILYVYRHHVI